MLWGPMLGFRRIMLQWIFMSVMEDGANPELCAEHSVTITQARFGAAAAIFDSLD